MRAARAEKEQARAAQAVSVSPDPRAAKRPRALSEGTVVTVETLASDVGELEDPLDAFFDHSPAFCEERTRRRRGSPSPGWLGGGCGRGRRGRRGRRAAARRLGRPPHRRVAARDGSARPSRLF